MYKFFLLKISLKIENLLKNIISGITKYKPMHAKKYNELCGMKKNKFIVDIFCI